MNDDSELVEVAFKSRQMGYQAGVEAERARCIAIASRDVEVVDQVSGTRFMRKPDCTCAKDIAGER